MSKNREIHITWSIKDVFEIRPDLSEEQAIEVLENIFKNHEADIGVSWDTLEFWANTMFPRKSPIGIYTVEITETLQKQVTVEAKSSDEAFDMVEQGYYNSDNILDSDNFVGAHFEVIGFEPMN